MPNAGILTLILIIITILVSNKGFSNSLFFDTYKFEVDRILINKDYKRLLTSGFLHVSRMHLIFNMFSLYLFSGVVGMALALAMNPSAFVYNYGKILVILVPTVVFIYLIITRPETLLVDNLFYKTHQDFYSIDHRYNAERADQQQEVDRILDKISRKGMKSLSQKEKKTLKAYSKNIH